jgi:hypothetical protein
VKSLEVQFSLLGDEFNWKPEYKSDEEELSEPFFLTCTVVNKSAAPVYYAILELWVEHDMQQVFSLPPLKQISAPL